MTSVTFSCPFCAEPRTVLADNVILDDNDGVYRVQCPKCSTICERDLTHRHREMLRAAGVLTIDELVSRWSTMLAKMPTFTGPRIVRPKPADSGQA